MKKFTLGTVLLAALMVLAACAHTYAEPAMLETEFLQEVKLESLRKLPNKSIELKSVYIAKSAVIDSMRLPPNEVGEIMIIMYHGLVAENPSEFDRTPADFRNDLQALYDGGYRLISMADLINNNITTPAGYTPVVLSFDDGRDSAFSLTQDEDGSLVPARDTAFYIINEFYEQNPAFGRGGIFFVNYHIEPFIGAGTIAERFAFLLDSGFELGNHGLLHRNFARLNPYALQHEIGLMDQFLRANTPDDFVPLALAYPFGIRPQHHMRHLTMEGEYNGVPYSYAWALRVGNTEQPAVPNHINFDPSNISRVNGTDASTPYRIVPDLGHLLRLFEAEPGLRFVSDGNPNALTVPEENLHLVNFESLGGMKLVVFEQNSTGYTP